jgi:hypothetical protein
MCSERDSDEIPGGAMLALSILLYGLAVTFLLLDRYGPLTGGGTSVVATAALVAGFRGRRQLKKFGDV